MPSPHILFVCPLRDIRGFHLLSIENDAAVNIHARFLGRRVFISQGHRLEAELPGQTVTLCLVVEELLDPF